MTFSEARFRPSLEERLESIISGAALMADSSCTRDDRRERIVAECNAVRQALQDLLSEYMNNVSAGLQALLISVDRAFTLVLKSVIAGKRVQVFLMESTVLTKNCFGEACVLMTFLSACSRWKN